MQVHRDIHHLPEFTHSVITIGTFDGVHTGHLQIIKQLKKEAAETGESVIITFDPHPRKVVSKGGSKPPIAVLNTLPEKIELLSRQGIHHLVVVPFTELFSNQPAQQYITDFLVAHFRPAVMITGYDHRFGKNREGDYHLLEANATRYGYKVKEIPEHVLHHITISSTKIREAIRDGNIAAANEFLGYDYFFEGKVIKGNQIGRTLGYPTANLQIDHEDKLVPADGIYAVEAELGSYHEECNAFVPVSHHKGMMSIGIRPTIGDHKRMIEVNLFHFNNDIYGRTMRVYVKAYLRQEIRFNTLDELKHQIGLDEIAATRILGEN